MKLLTSLSSFAALAITCRAFVSPSSALQKRDVCADGIVTPISTIAVGDKIVDVSTVNCPASIKSRFVNKRQANVTVDVCDALCSNSCNSDSGDVPPAVDDCSTIVNAIEIMSGSGTMSTTFVVEPDDVMQLTYSTCRFFFENMSGDTLEYCWDALSDTASSSVTECFPSTQSLYSEGLCQASSGTWAVGAAHA
ncbi:hypothetical protein WOLCODRAFT_166574 [Wolfiporia cocos MD-104 SS10]|uniref:Immunomodulatory protein n=1 Tax=Wolfiporia cocos (strain MD-104) TaxID=742152 RepID=A0A2H3J859_WOLCO|nr:hypothetical protein WOLCODRAFT_166574 [Wolfiporia cocos MD-104 SS10]